MSFRLIVTIGPANLRKDVLPRIHALGPCIYRINGAHVQPDQLPKIAKDIRSWVRHPALLLDLPGNKVRTARLKQPVVLKPGKTFSLRPQDVNYPLFYRHLKPGMQILANDSLFTLRVEKINGDAIVLRSLSQGLLHSNKGLHASGIHDDIPFLFDKDLALIAAAKRARIDNLSLSFVRSAQDIGLVKKTFHTLGYAPEIFAKVEMRCAVQRLSEILKAVKVINIDRGDLSTDVPWPELYAAQQQVVRRTLKKGRQVFLATQFLKNMELFPVPLISEIMDVSRALADGVSGIQLSEETAVGKYPVECARLIFDFARAARRLRA